MFLKSLFINIFFNGTEKKNKNRTTRAVREDALCAGRLARRAGALGAVPLQWSRKGGVPTGPHPFAWPAAVGIFCMRHVKPLTMTTGRRGGEDKSTAAASEG